MSLINDFLHNQMRKTTRVITLHGRYLLMKQTKHNQVCWEKCYNNLLTVYSGVGSLTNLRLAMFLAELNNLQLWGADVGYAYLQALTKEKLYIVGVVLNSKNYKDIFLLCTRHSMVQVLEEHVGMTKVLISSIKWVSNLQRQTQIYG